MDESGRTTSPIGGYGHGALEPNQESMNIYSQYYADRTKEEIEKVEKNLRDTHTINLVSGLSENRHQGARGTCSAFAVVAVVEQYLARKEARPIKLSEQFLYNECKLMDKAKDICGAYLATAVKVVSEIGICPADKSPYIPTGKCNQLESYLQPQQTAQRQEAVHAKTKIQMEALRHQKSVDEIKAALLREACVAVSFPVFKSWKMESNESGTLRF